MGRSSCIQKIVRLEMVRTEIGRVHTAKTYTRVSCFYDDNFVRSSRHIQLYTGTGAKMLEVTIRNLKKRLTARPQVGAVILYCNYFKSESNTQEIRFRSKDLATLNRSLAADNYNFRLPLSYGLNYAKPLFDFNLYFHEYDDRPLHRHVCDIA